MFQVTNTGAEPAIVTLLFTWEVNNLLKDKLGFFCMFSIKKTDPFVSVL